MASATVEFTKEEAEALLALLDVAVKAAGLNVAQNAIALALKVRGAFPVGAPVAANGAAATAGAAPSA